MQRPIFFTQAVNANGEVFDIKVHAFDAMLCEMEGYPLTSVRVHPPHESGQYYLDSIIHPPLVPCDQLRPRPMT